MIHMHITSAMTAHLKITAQNPQLNCNEYSAVTNTLSNIFPVHVCLHQFTVRHHDEPCEPVRAVKGESYCCHNISVIQQHAAHYMNMQPNVKTSATPCHAILTNCFAIIHRFFPKHFGDLPCRQGLRKITCSLPDQLYAYVCIYFRPTSSVFTADPVKSNVAK